MSESVDVTIRPLDAHVVFKNINLEERWYE